MINFRNLAIGKCKSGQIADYSLANDTWWNVFFKFWKCEKVLEIVDKTYKVFALHNGHLAGMFNFNFLNLSDHFVVLRAGRADTDIAFFSCQRPGWGHIGRMKRKLERKWWMQHFRHHLVQYHPCEQVTWWFSLVKQLKHSELHTGFSEHWGLRNLFVEFFI